jgi:dTDP-glucose pyrophosphorylase
MNSNISVFVLAAGMGSRYGGLKQMEGFGPSGETLIDYSIYDAIKAGFNKIVFVIRPDMEEAFKEVFLSKYEGKINIEYCFQTLDMVPEWYKLNPERTKPWGTGHALLVGKDSISEPFIVINGDDFYGRESFEKAYRFLQEDCSPTDSAILGYVLKNVLGDGNGVKRGICTVKEGYLEKIDETFDVKRDGEGKINGTTWDGIEMKDVDEDTFVSMNMFCFHPNIFKKYEREFNSFLTELNDEVTGEFLITKELTDLINNGETRVKVLKTESSWFGITSKEDVPVVKDSLKSLVESGEYPFDLFASEN